MPAHDTHDLSRIYAQRFTRSLAYRKRVWKVLIHSYFSQFIAASDTVLDLGCGYGEFINQIPCRQKIGMDLNPDSPQHLDQSVQFLAQDCSAKWAIADHTLDVVFTSNFFEHLPDKAALGKTLDEIRRCLRPGGRLIAMGPNIKFLPGTYWDFWDHYVALTELSLSEALQTRSFQIEKCFDRFLPYTMANGREFPPFLIETYLKLPFFWKFFGKQFLVIAQKAADLPD